MTANAARNYQLKVIQIGGDVERESVHRHPARDANAYRRELFLSHPDAHEIAVARFRIHAEVARRADQRFLNISHITANVLMAGQQFDDRIPYKLAGAMVGHIAAAPGFKKLDAELGARGVVSQNVRAIRRASERASSLTRQLLAFSRRQILDLRVLDLRETVRGMESMLQRLIGEDIAVKNLKVVNVKR